MSAAHQTLARVAEEAPEVVRRVRGPHRTAVVTAPGGADGHVHCAIFWGDDGEGFTSPGPDGHIHKVRELEVRPVLGHGHDMSATRCNERHNPQTGRHVHARR